jgi:CelD/BcsL family acetyltransferase involved in cellulose biosynthesis
VPGASIARYGRAFEAARRTPNGRRPVLASLKGLLIMKLSVVCPEELGAVELARWRDLQRCEASLRNPFLCPEFTLGVGRVRDDARVAVLEDGQRVVGFFPYERRAFGVGKPIGAGLSDCQGLLHDVGLEWDPLALLRSCGLAVWEFDHLVSSQAPFTPYHVSLEPSPIMDLSDGYAAYLEERRRASKAFKGLSRRARQLEREVGDVRFEFDDRDHGGLGLLMAWKSAQYRATSRMDRFARPWIVRLVEDIFETRAKGFSGLLSVLYAGGRPIAGHFGMRSDAILSTWFPSYDVSFSKYSPGLLLHLSMAEEAAAAGLQHIDLGKGFKRYKELLKSRDLTVAEGWVERPSSVAALRRLQRTPTRFATKLVLDHPARRERADRALKRLGRIRSALGH